MTYILHPKLQNDDFGAEPIWKLLMAEKQKRSRRNKKKNYKKESKVKMRLLVLSL